MSAAKKQKKEATFYSILKKRNPSQFLATSFEELLDINGTKFHKLREIKDEYNASFKGRAGEINGNDVNFLRCLIKMLINDMDLKRKASPSTYLSYFSPLVDSIPVRVNRPSMAAMMQGDTNISERTIYDITERVLAAGDRFVTQKKNTSLVRKEITDPDGHTTIIYEVARDQHGNPVVGRGDFYLYVSKKWLKFKANIEYSPKNSSTDNQRFIKPNYGNLPQTKEDSFRTNNILIKNNPQQVESVLEGVSSKQFFKKTSATASEDFKSKNKPGKTQMAAKGAAGAIGEGRRDLPVRVLGIGEYEQERQQIDRMVQNSQPSTKTDTYARYLYLMMNELLFPNNTDWYVQVAQEECMEKIKLIMRSYPYGLDMTFKYLSTGILKAKKFQEKHPDWEFQNIKKWLEMDNPYGFYQRITEGWMPIHYKNIKIGSSQSRAKMKSVKCQAQVRERAMQVLNTNHHSYSAAKLHYISNGRYLLGYFKRYKISQKVAESAWNNYVNLTKPILVKVKQAAFYEKSEEWQSFLKELELADFMML